MEDGRKALDDIKEAFDSAKIWDPIILLPTCHILENSDGSYSCVTPVCNKANDSASDKSTSQYANVDLIKLMRLSLNDMEALQEDLMQTYNYPQHTLIRLEGLRGIQDKQRARKLIFDAARSHGTQLCSRSTCANKTSAHRSFTMNLGCVHAYRDRKGSKSFITHTFKSDKVQASNTLLGREHGSHVYKDKSKSSTMKIANRDKATLIPRRDEYKVKKKAGLKNRTVTKASLDKRSACNFGIVVMLSKKDDYWYIAWNARKGIYANISHNNHFPVDPKHMWISKKSLLSSKCQKTITEAIINGINVPSIVQMVYIQFGIHIRPSVISKMGAEELESMHFLDSNDASKSNTAAEKLMNLLKSLDDVSYIVLKHHAESGFVTYTRQEKRSISLDSTSTKECQLWRKELLLNNNEEILVSCAWCHDEEKRKADMYPEYLSVDTTFGMNKQKRSLFTAVGTDGSNKTYVAFRCWMPSKQKSAFYWTITQAMPLLLGTKTVSKFKLISSDSEKSLEDAIKGAINVPDSEFKNATFRSDFFHFFELRWKKLISLLNNNDLVFQEKSNTVKSWVFSWFNEILSEDELKISYDSLKDYFTQQRRHLGSTFIAEMRKIIHEVMARKDDLLHYAFKNKTTFGYLGSSVVEAMNSSIKKSTVFSISGKMSMCHSTLLQIKQTEYRSFKQSQVQANAMNMSLKYINVDIGEYLTQYMVDIAVKNYDRRTRYHVRRKNDTSFWVIRRSILHEQKDNAYDSPIPKFDHLYQVTYEHNFMTCTCGYVHQYLAPCVHVLAVLDDRKYFTHDLFHYRWWKHYEYFFDRDFPENEILNRNEIKSINDKISKWVHYIDKHAFLDGEYRGCYLSGLCLDHLLAIEKVEDQIYYGMETFVKEVERNGPKLSQPLIGQQRSESESFPADNLVGFEESMLMDVSLSQNTQLKNSQVTDDEESMRSDEETIGSIFQYNERGSDLWNKTMEAWDEIKTRQLEQEWMDWVVAFKYRAIAKNASKRKNIDTSIFGGELNSSRIETKRKRYAFERA